MRQPCSRRGATVALLAAAPMLLALAASPALGQPPRPAEGPEELHDTVTSSTSPKALPPRDLGPVEGDAYEWRDGGRKRQAFLQTDLVVVARDPAAVAASGEIVARVGDGEMIRVDAASGGEVEGQPVFRSRSGTLMTLPGGVLLVLDRDWERPQIDAFFARNGIAVDDVGPLGELPNGFLVATEPGFASLDLANALADQPGVDLSSPNWWREAVAE